tara:strand:- start:2067 stop:2417 length:351 start_codon:yes stop_codon:yes gene_type:complete
MGLDTSHNCWHGPYSSFGRFRDVLAKEIGINLKDYFGYGGDNPTKHLEDIDHDIMPLLNHSDCDGELSVEDSKRIVKGLESILETYTEDDYFRDKMIQFRDGLLDAISSNEVVDFH